MEQRRQYRLRVLTFVRATILLRLIIGDGDFMGKENGWWSIVAV